MVEVVGVILAVLTIAAAIYPLGMSTARRPPPMTLERWMDEARFSLMLLNPLRIAVDVWDGESTVGDAIYRLIGLAWVISGLVGAFMILMMVTR